MKEGDRANRIEEDTASSAMVAQDAPVLEPRDRVLDPSASLSMPPPRLVSDDPILVKSRRSQFRDSSIAAIGKHAPVLATACLDARAAIVNGVVSIPRSTTGHFENAKIRATSEHLRVA